LNRPLSTFFFDLSVIFRHSSGDLHTFAPFIHLKPFTMKRRMLLPLAFGLLASANVMAQSTGDAEQMRQQRIEKASTVQRTTPSPEVRAKNDELRAINEFETKIEANKDNPNMDAAAERRRLQAMKDAFEAKYPTKD